MYSYTKLILCLLLTTASRSYASNPLMDFLQQLKQANATPLMTYDYKMYLVRNDIAEDSITGVMYKQQDDYLDSNTQALSMSSAGYFCKLEFDARRATVFAIRDFHKRMGTDAKRMRPSVLDLSDSVIFKYGQVTTQRLPNGNSLLRVSFKDRNISVMEAELNREDYRVCRIAFEVPETDRYGEATGYKRVYHMINFRYAFDKNIFSGDRFFRVSGKKIALNGKYTAYHLITLTN